jgi:clan AA aspartic protease
VGVKEPLFGREKRFIAPIDTGFAGYLLVPAETYARLGTLELPREDFGLYSTMAGQIILRRAEVKLQIGERELYTYIETPMHGSGKTLLGRRILRELDLALLGEQQKCCHLTPSRK